jgi:DNA-binding MarR family transcriptional regulator
MDIVKELNLDSFTEEEKNEILVQLTDSLLKRLFLRVQDNLNEQDRKELEQLSEKKDQQKIEEFLREKIPNLDQIRDEELRGLVEEMRDFISGE